MKHVDVEPRSVNAVSIQGGDLRRLLLGGGAGLLASPLIVPSRAGKTVSGELEDRVSSEGEVGDWML